MVWIDFCFSRCKVINGLLVIIVSCLLVGNMLVRIKLVFEVLRKISWFFFIKDSVLVVSCCFLLLLCCNCFCWVFDGGV